MLNETLHESRKKADDFGVLTGEKKTAYFPEIHSGLDKQYAPMEKLFEEIIEQSFSTS